MHQSCIVKAKGGHWHLLSIGGKADTKTWLNSVEAIDLTPYFLTGLVDKDGKQITSEWTQWADMNSPRSNFSVTVVDNVVFAFGGITGQSQGD